MKIIFRITLPIEPFNTLAKAGHIAQKMRAIMEATKPETIYFTSGHGAGRGALAVYDMKDGSQIPALCEPWFFTFHANIETSIAMTPEELGRSGLDELVKKWA